MFNASEKELSYCFRIKELFKSSRVIKSKQLFSNNIWDLFIYHIKAPLFHFMLSYTIKYSCQPSCELCLAFFVVILSHGLFVFVFVFVSCQTSACGCSSVVFWSLFLYFIRGAFSWYNELYKVNSLLRVAAQVI